jgi:uncharacterized protein involved in outer membrane biogenesis
MRVPRKAWILLTIVGAIVLVVALFEWNWLRGPISTYVSAKVGRPVKIDGDLHVDLSWKPLLTAESVTVGNASWSSEPLMVDAQRVAVRIAPLSLFVGPLSLPEVRLTRTNILLERGTHGHGNWELPGPTQIPEVGLLDIDDGVVHYVYADGTTDVTVKVKTAPASAGGETPVHFSGSGRLRNNPFTIEGDAASLLALEKVNRPYRLNAQARAGYTSAKFDGTIVPNQIDNVDGTLTLQGRDLSQLYPIIPVPFPWTPPYRLNGHLTHSGKLWTFEGFKGKVGDSDVAGKFALDQSKDRPFVDADLVSTRLDYKDLGGLLGLPPPGEPPSARTAAQNKEAAKREVSGRVLPTKPYDLEKLRIVDAAVRFKGKRFQTTDLPLDDMSATLDLKEGVLKLRPLDFGVGGGRVQSTIVLDARERVIKTSGDVTVRNVELKEILPAIKPPKGSAGKVGGRARFDASGNSIADMLSSSNGEVALISRGGEASALAVVLTNLDLANAAALLIKGDENAPIRCVVADFVTVNGVMTPRTLVMDTEAEKILGEGSVDFAKEQYDLRLNAKSKKPSVMALRGPILVDGTFKSPRVHPAVGPIAVRVGASVALGTTLTPLAALLPLIDFGGASDADCRALIEEAKENVEAHAAGPARTKPSTREAASNRDKQSPREATSGRERQSARGESPKVSAAE